MSDVAKIIFDADLEPLDQKVEEGKKKINDFVDESQAKLKGIKGPGDTVSDVGETFNEAGKLKEIASSGAATSVKTAEAEANVALATTSQVAAVAETEQALATDLSTLSARSAAIARFEETAATQGLTAAVLDLAAADLALASPVLGIALGVALPLIVATKIATDEYARSSRTALKIEETISVEYGRQQKALFELKTETLEFARLRANNDAGRTFDKNTSDLIGRHDVESLEQQRSSLEKQREVLKESARLGDIYGRGIFEKTVDDEKLKTVTDQILKLDEAIAQTRESSRALLNPTPTEVSTNAIDKYKQQVTEAGKAIPALKAILSEAQNDLTLTGADRQSFVTDLSGRITEDIKAAKEKVKEAVKEYRAEFSNLYVGSVSDNPFAQNMVANATAVDLLKEKLAGVTPELRKTAQGLLETAQAQKTFSLQINNAFETIDLRSQADKFRGPTQKELQADFNRKLSEFRRTSNSTNPDVFYNFRREQQDILDFEKVKKQRVIDEKLDIAERAKTPAERAIADRAVITFAGGVNPDDINQSDRGRIADAFERSAARNESRQEEALSTQKELLATLKAIDARGQALLGVANESGQAGVERATKFDITLRDDTSDKKATAAAATSSDVAATYNFPIAGPGGSNL